jgi:hypothetical protein
LIGAKLAEARPGGGQSYSGGSSSYSGGSSGGGGGYSSGGSDYGSDYGGDYGGGDANLDGSLFFVIVLVLLIFGYIVFQAVLYSGPTPGYNSWNSTPYIPPRPPDLTEIVYRDAKFSTVIFEDFLYHLYAAAHQARASAEELASLAPHFTPGALKQLGSRLPYGKPVDRIVIGSMTPTRLTMPHQAESEGGRPYYIKLAVRFESNMRIGAGDERQAYYVNETWNLSRAANVESVPEARMRATLCDNCGAPFAGSQERKCSSCGELVGSGKHSWVVSTPKALQATRR